jgi:hypothetical protein
MKVYRRAGRDHKKGNTLLQYLPTNLPKNSAQKIQKPTAEAGTYVTAHVCAIHLMTDSRIWSVNSMKLVKGFREYKR